MKNKIKAFASAVSVMVMTVPMLVSAAEDIRRFSPTADGTTGLPEGTLTNIIANIMNWLLMMIGVFGVIGFAIAGVLYLTAAGDEGRIETAKTAMMYSIIGVIVAIIGVVVMQAANTLLGGDSSNF